MTINRYYMHKNAMDVCIHIRHISDLCPPPDKDCYAQFITVHWYNLGYAGHPWFVEDEKIWVDNKMDWIDVTGKMSIIRTQAGIPI